MEKVNIENVKPRIADAALDYINRGWSVIPIPFRSKFPVIQGWQNVKISEIELTDYFNGKPQNIGVLLGEKSGGLVDIDLDSPEAVKLADWFLPKTESLFGRKGKPLSHRLYYCDEVEYHKFNNPLLLASADENQRKNACIVEIRANSNGKGKQTVFPPSVHECGEPIEWVSNGEPLRIINGELEPAVGKLAAAALLARYWRRGVRQDLTLAVAGALIRHGFTTDSAKHFIKAICSATNDEEMSKRLRAVDSTAERIAKRENVYGFPQLAELTDEKIVKAICDCLEFQNKTDKASAEVTEATETGFHVICLNDVEAEEIEWLLETVYSRWGVFDC